VNLQPYTHICLGLAATCFFADQPAAQTAVMIGSLVPDMPVYAKLAHSVARHGKSFQQAFQRESETYLRWYYIFHSAIIWLVALFYFPLWLGVNLHLLLDLISHKNGQPLYPLFPLKIKVRGLFDYRDRKFPFWDIAVSTICLLIFFLK